MTIKSKFIFDWAKTMLFELLEKGKYIFMADRIYEFETIDHEEILLLKGYVGNNNVTYSWAYSSKYCYFLNDAYVAVPKHFFDEKKDAWHQYWKEKSVPFSIYNIFKKRDPNEEIHVIPRNEEIKYKYTFLDDGLFEENRLSFDPPKN